MLESNQYVKIAKTATKKSIMDVTASLNYRKKNKSNEHVYKGKVIFSITEMETGKYEKAYVDKASTKLLLHAMIHDRFLSLFGEDGMTDYGGTVSDEGIRSRILNIKMSPRKQYVFTISEGEGVRDAATGSISMKGKPSKTVQTYIAYLEALKMAHEVYDFIQQEELAATIKGEPLYTIGEYAGEFSAKEKNDGGPSEKKSFVFPAGPFKGKAISSLKNEELKILYEKARASDAEEAKKIKGLVEEEIMERRKRK